MKLHGQKISEPNVVELYLPRANDDVIVIKAKAVLDYSEFNKLCPAPEPPVKIMRGGAKQPDFEHPAYKAQLSEYGVLKTNWMFLKSLQGTEGLEWETVDMADTSTWKNFEQELQDSGFSETERLRIVNAVTEANALNERKLEEARERFLSGTHKPEIPNGKSTSPSGDQKNTPSGGLVSVPESSRQG